MNSYSITFAFLIMAITSSCSLGSIGADRPDRDPTNSVYYWKTVFNPDDADLSFIKAHNIGRIYLRMFDVSADTYATDADEMAVPNATVRIGDNAYRQLTDSLSELEFIPVVYVTLDALKAMGGREGVLADNIVMRVNNMCQYNSLPNVHELQLDCDWTVSTENSFFSLCDSVKQSIDRLELPWQLSSTIRLHQLARKVPPVDRGVLMVYNTGNFNNPDAKNSILDPLDVEPYLKHLSSYRLPLDVAYPTYSWQLLFSKRRFAGLLNSVDLSDTTRFARITDNSCRARRDIPYRNMIIRTGDIIREETSDYKDIAAVRGMIESRLSGRKHSNILYHLDSGNLSKYSSDEIDNILSTAR